ncbi:MAG: 50S ribosomal protein L15 [Proteobacteria bacterium]|nr:50S ribosomal protein L15 [Pseudomonadota bacterium]
MLHKLENAPGAANKNRRRVGRGAGSTLGKTSGRGHKGQNSRSGSKRRIGFEGGQMPIHRRLPKRGFKNIFRQEYSIVNLGDIVECKKIDRSGVVNIESLIKAGLVRNDKLPLKILGDGTVEGALTIEAQKFSASAEKKILDSGGTATVVKK